MCVMVFLHDSRFTSHFFPANHVFWNAKTNMNPDYASASIREKFYLYFTFIFDLFHALFSAVYWVLALGLRWHIDGNSKTICDRQNDKLRKHTKKKKESERKQKSEHQNHQRWKEMCGALSKMSEKKICNCTYVDSCSNIIDAFMTSRFTTGPIRMLEY